MGILDDAIRDHLELKRKGGTQEADLQRLEDEAFGPPSRPGAAPGAVATAEPPAEVKSEPSGGPSESPTGETSAPTVQAPTPEAAEQAPAEPAEPVEPRGEDDAPDVSAPQGGGSSEGVGFHDFAAEEGLVGPSAEEPPIAPVEEEAAAPPSEPQTPPPGPAEPAPPGDTQPHDVESEFGAAATPSESPPADADAAGGPQIELDDDLELHLDEEDLGSSAGVEERAEPDTGSDEPPSEPDSDPELAVVEEEEVVEEDVEVVEEPPEETGDEKEAPGEDGEEDVLEETPDFLRETPEHDRLWFEQKPPKDFDFDE